MKKLSIAAALLAALISTVVSSAAQAKTFVGVLWPMFGPLPAIGLVELTAEIRTMQDVEVHTYLHQEWPDLVRDMKNLPEGTRTIVIGYSLGANATSWVVNKSKYVDLVIALQPSMLSWNPTITGRAGRIIEVYNPSPWMTFGGMGSKKLEWTAGNIEYMPNNDSHPGAQFNLEFRSMVKAEVAKMTAEPPVEVARANSSVRLAYAEQGSRNPLSQLKDASQKDAAQKDSKKDAVLRELAEKDAKALEAKASEAKTLEAKASGQKYASAGDLTGTLQADAQQVVATPMQPRRPQAQAQPAKLTTVAADFAKRQPKAWTAFLDGLSSSVNAGNVASRELTVADMMDYAQRTYDFPRKGDSLIRKQASLVGGNMIVASDIDPHGSGSAGACCAFVKAEGDVD